MLAIAVGAPAAAVADEVSITVHKDPNCGCCSGWVQHVRDAGFSIRVEETSELALVRNRLGVPAELAACHTAEIAGYLLEGHVPAQAIRRLLSERPKARGLAVLGMPAGSPGMEAANPQPYSVVLFGSEGHKPFMRFKGVVAAEE
ncbi:DUF411 domain-containing protein [Afipia felis]|nr:DUF411 domain-containing protein [Afipia felis]RTL65061.1 MAG: DUF411 domain-containing protein [Pseudonocardiaceae bacterium]